MSEFMHPESENRGFFDNTINFVKNLGYRPELSRHGKFGKIVALAAVVITLLSGCTPKNNRPNPSERYSPDSVEGVMPSVNSGESGTSITTKSDGQNLETTPSITAHEGTVSEPKTELDKPPAEAERTGIHSRVSEDIPSYSGHLEVAPVLNSSLQELDEVIKKLHQPDSFVVWAKVIPEKGIAYIDSSNPRADVDSAGVFAHGRNGWVQIIYSQSESEGKLGISPEDCNKKIRKIVGDNNAPTTTELEWLLEENGDFDPNKPGKVLIYEGSEHHE